MSQLQGNLEGQGHVGCVVAVGQSERILHKLVDRVKHGKLWIQSQRRRVMKVLNKMCDMLQIGDHGSLPQLKLVTPRCQEVLHLLLRLRA